MNYTISFTDHHYQVLGKDYKQLFNEEASLIKEAAELRAQGASLRIEKLDFLDRVNLELKIEKELHELVVGKS